MKYWEPAGYLERPRYQKLWLIRSRVVEPLSGHDPLFTGDNIFGDLL